VLTARLIVRATVIAVLTALLMSLSFPASAGGPTSALLSIPGQGRTSSLYYTDAAYDELSRLVGVGEAYDTVDDSGNSHAAGTEVTVTWLIHDVTPWRIDRIYLAADGGPWIATQELDQSGSIWEGPVVWHRATSGKELSMLLDGLGLGFGSKAPGVVPDAVPDNPAQEPAAVDPATETQQESPAASPAGTDDGSSGAWWGLGGLAAGLLLALGWTRARSRRVEEPAPDLDPAKDWLVSRT
jgi:hypothetical protein